MGDAEAVPHRGAVTAGAIISGTFGLVWTNWGASGVTGAASEGIRAAGIVAGLVILVGCARLWRPAPRASSVESWIARSMEGSRFVFSWPSYLVVVAIEVAAIGGGGKLLNATGHSDYVITWVALVVGTHFLAFGRLFWAGFYWFGTALIAAAIVGVTVGFVGGGSDAIKATSGLIAAASMFAATGWSLEGARAIGTHA